jgi:hypothetical protein
LSKLQYSRMFSSTTSSTFCRAPFTLSTTAPIPPATKFLGNHFRYLIVRRQQAN